MNKINGGFNFSISFGDLGNLSDSFNEAITSPEFAAIVEEKFQAIMPQIVSEAFEEFAQKQHRKWFNETVDLARKQASVELNGN